MRSNTTEECVMLAQNIFTQISGDFQPHLIDFWVDSIAHIAKTRSSHNVSEPWQSSVYGNRHGVKASIPGILGEYIAIAALQWDESATDIVISADKHQQMDLMIDFIDNATNTSYQVKTIRTLGGMVNIDWRISAPDCLVLVDIDDNTTYVIPTTGYESTIRNHPDTRPNGQNGIQTGWTCNVELLQEMNTTQTHDTRHLYTKPCISDVDVSMFNWDSVV